MKRPTLVRSHLGKAMLAAFGLVSFLSLMSIASCNNASQANITQWPTDQTCNLDTESCIAQMGDATVALKISPHPIPIARPLGIEVLLENIEAEKVELDISGINMYMGYNRVSLTPTDKPGRYVGTSMLAFCTNKKMQWQITLMITQKDGSQIQIPYRLDTITY
ncbi:MAG: hypothetical protein ACQEQR_03585 [Pseudomonadota bacterium]